ncbi:SDR family oxidoreductase [Paenibacillus harenae]|uniref:NAD(P)-dependent dehydrogenase (Short-subunit alcohol dehydrogenase family) n=1 Tax=Paenibacillus harenae TaxID=306543 RepID=A0ABT9U5F5_PAEHA|nr:SDR family oxidoreductase [Paenibacillus harenae]MDQ0114872.1 NAD(P)-dependent dehydrogenase (short-subunit alcohol dehydrogenase family) [Paenibacillus harenae]
MNKLFGKTIVVAGATGGIGEGVTKLLLQHGAKVVALSRNEEKLEQLRAYLSGVDTGNLITLKENLDQDQAGSREVSDRLKEQFGHFDGAIVTIGNWGAANRSLIDVSDELWEQAVQDNLTSHFRTLRTLVPLLKKDGALIHLSGLSADTPYPGAGIIGLTNAAKKSLVLTMAAEQGSIGPRIYELMIGPIRTRERVTRGIARSNWYDPEDLGVFMSELIQGDTEASQKPLHYMVQRGG